MYITKKQLKGFKTYKYSCIDDSPIAIYITKPLWRTLVNLIPKNIAPNTLTVVGFLFTILQFILLTIYDPTFNAQSSARIRHFDSISKSHNSVTPESLANDGLPGRAVPQWVWLCCAVFQFLSYAADGVDGNQARRIGLSSPLGEMMDHGIDSWTCSFIMMTIFSCIGASEEYEKGLTMVDMFCMSWTLNFMFFSTHVEKLASGTLILPWSFDLSIISTIFMYIVIAFYGSNFWIYKIFGTITYLSALRIGFYIAGAYGIAKDTYSTINLILTGKSQRPLKDIFASWISIILACGIYALWIFGGTAPRSINLFHPRIVLLGCGGLFTNILCRLLIYQMSHTKPTPIINPGILVLLGFYILDTFIIHHAYITTIIWPLCSILLILMHLHFCFIVVNKLAKKI